MAASWTVPEGMRDQLPAEAARQRWLENALAGFFSSWGYMEVIPPTLEYDEVFNQRNQFRLIDGTGRVLALRPDLTTPMARVAATRLEQVPLPLRLFYCGRVFRYQNPAVGSQREFSQAGVELIGAAGARADAEVISLAIEVLQALGLKGFQISLGQVQITERLLAADLEPAQREEIRKALSQKNYVELQRILEQQDTAARRPWLPVDLQGGQEVLARLRHWLPEEEKPRQELEDIWSALEGNGLDGYLALDFTLVRDLDYYTGTVFEIYAPGIGFPIGGGGRYDGLVARFGRDLPATGFAFGVERLLEALGDNVPPAPALDFLVGGKDLAGIFATARRLRQQGQRVQIWLAACSAGELAAAARQRGIPAHVYID